MSPVNGAITWGLWSDSEFVDRIASGRCKLALTYGLRVTVPGTGFTQHSLEPRTQSTLPTFRSEAGTSGISPASDRVSARNSTGLSGFIRACAHLSAASTTPASVAFRGNGDRPP